MNNEAVRPQSYPDDGARNPERKLDGLLRQKFYYYGGSIPDPSSEQAAALTQTKFKNMVISNLIILSKGQNELTAQTLFEESARILVNIYSLNPHVLAVAIHINNIMRPGTIEEIRTKKFRDEFVRLFKEDWNLLFTQLSKIQDKGNNKRTINEKSQMSDVIRYIQLYVVHKASEEN